MKAAGVSDSMPELNREQHRERVRQSYLKNSFESMNDANVLELILFYSIPRKDVKEIAYALINRFGSLEGVFEADIRDLMKIDGVGENTAILINLFQNTRLRIEKNKNRNIKRLDNSEKAMHFARNELYGQNRERVIVICLDNSLNIISVNDVSLGNSSAAGVETYKIMECIFKDSASNVIIAHNHPKGDAKPSIEDINFTLEIINICRKVNVRVNDHIIVGENEVFSMANDIECAMYFDN